VVDRYATWLEEQVRQGNPAVVRTLNQIYQALKRRGDITLLCFCAPRRCHGEVIAQRLRAMAQAEGLEVEIRVSGRN
jgi:hypothetical protein